MAPTRKKIALVLDKYPELAENGWLYPRLGKNPEDSDRIHAEDRARVLADVTGDYAAQFDRATEYLTAVPRENSVPKKGPTSYTWKHQAERHFLSRTGAHGYYISNGMFIAAAIALGFEIRRIRNSPNCYLNIPLGGPHTEPPG